MPRMPTMSTRRGFVALCSLQKDFHEWEMRHQEHAPLAGATRCDRRNCERPVEQLVAEGYRDAPVAVRDGSCVTANLLHARG